MFGQGTKQTLNSFNNESFEKFLGGGLLNSSLNFFERQGPSSRLLDSIWNKSFAASTLATKNNLIFVNFNSLIDIQDEQFMSSLPLPRKVKPEILFKDIRSKSATSKIKIAWRYSHRNSSPSDSILRVDQVDFGLSLAKEAEVGDIGKFKIINIKEDRFSLEDFFQVLETVFNEMKKDGCAVNIIIKDLLNPFSPLIDDTQKLCKFIYTLRCFARTMQKGAILVGYDIGMCNDHINLKQHLYNMADCVVSFYSYETGQNRLTGYKDTDGTLEYVKVPKINSFGLHFQRELSDWGYRLTRNHRFFVVDELSLPPCDDDEDDVSKQTTRKRQASEVTKIRNSTMSLEQVGPLEDLREIAGDVLAKLQ